MNDEKKIKSALISVFSKEGLEQLISLLNENEVEIYSTGGTQKYQLKNYIQIKDLLLYMMINYFKTK